MTPLVYLLLAVTGLGFAVLFRAIFYVIVFSTVVPPPSIRTSLADFGLIAMAGRVGILPYSVYDDSCGHRQIALDFSHIKRNGNDRKSVKFSVWQYSFALDPRELFWGSFVAAQKNTVEVPSENRWRFSKISEAESDNNLVPRNLHSWIGIASYVICNPDVGTLVRNKVLASIFELAPKNPKGGKSSEAEKSGEPYHPPIWVIRLFGWFFLALAWPFIALAN